MVDEPFPGAHLSGMNSPLWHPADSSIRVVGSLASPGSPVPPDSCDMLEIRLDLTGILPAEQYPAGLPVLITARRGSEGGAGDLDAGAREALLREALPHASCVDIEVASITEMDGLIRDLAARKIPWIASFHDFTKLPEDFMLKRAAKAARDAGAAVFKAAAQLHSPEDVARLARFQMQDHGIAVATMGMGALAPVSRLLCAQCGSVLNYGYLGETPTAPGQWSAAELKRAISSLQAFTK